MIEILWIGASFSRYRQQGISKSCLAGFNGSRFRQLFDPSSADKRLAVNKATIESKQHASSKAAYDAQRAEHALSSMTLKAPSNGTISLVSVWHNGGEGPFKPGERAWSGAPIAELPDVASLRIAARVDETERGRLALSQPVTMQLDAIADRQFTSKVERTGAIASSDFSAGWPIPRNFDLQITTDQADQRLKPGMTVQITVIVDRMANAITIPTQASFLKSGRTVPNGRANADSWRFANSATIITSIQ